jgi:hypothetical protein
MQELVNDDVAALAPLVAAAIQHARQHVPPEAVSGDHLQPEVLDAVRLKESVYCAACALEFQLYEYIDFPEWLRGWLLPELQLVRTATFSQSPELPLEVHCARKSIRNGSKCLQSCGSLE